MKYWFIGLIVLLTGCYSSQNALPPVIDASRLNGFDVSPSVYIVQPNDTLYAIAFRFDKDYRVLAQINGLSSPYQVYVGQRIVFEKKKQLIKVKSIVSHQKMFFMKPVKSGTILNTFSPALGRKGIDFLGQKGQFVYAAESGVVVYVGERLSGYGSLILIKHGQQWLTAYGHNAQNLVKEGQLIKKGQTIAKMGMLDRLHWGLHFEIRQNGLSVNPQRFF